MIKRPSSSRHSGIGKPDITIDMDPSLSFLSRFRFGRFYIFGFIFFLLFLFFLFWLFYFSSPKFSFFSDDFDYSRLASIESDIASLRSDISRLSSDDSLQSEISDLSSRLNVLSSDLSSLRDFSRSLIESHLSQIDHTPVRLDGTTITDASALALLNLRLAISTGAPFTDSLRLAQVLVKDNDLQKLSAYSDSGVMSILSLRASFDSLVPRLVDSDSSSLFSFDSSFIRVRPLSSNSSIIDRLRISLSNGDLSEVLVLWERLGDDAKSISGEWHSHVSSKHTVDLLLSQLISSFSPSHDPSDG